MGRLRETMGKKATRRRVPAKGKGPQKPAPKKTPKGGNVTRRRSGETDDPEASEQSQEPHDDDQAQGSDVDPEAEASAAASAEPMSDEEASEVCLCGRPRRDHTPDATHEFKARPTAEPVAVDESEPTDVDPLLGDAAEKATERAKAKNEFTAKRSARQVARDEFDAKLKDAEQTLARTREAALQAFHRADWERLALLTKDLQASQAQVDALIEQGSEPEEEPEALTA